MKVLLKIFIIGIFATSAIALVTKLDSDKIIHELYSGGKFKDDNNLVEVPEDFFKDPSRSNADYVQFDNNTFTTLPESLFKVLNNLKNISIFNDSLTILPNGIFQGLPNLIRIKFELNNLTTLPRKLFSDQTNLLYLTIKRNYLKILEDGIFEHTYALKELDLSHNQLVTISG